MRHIAKLFIFTLLTSYCYSMDFDPETFQIDKGKIESGSSSAEIGKFAKEEAERADLILNEIYNEILLQYEENPNFISQLRIAQRNWILYRDSHLHSIFPFENSDSDPRNYVGNGYGFERNIELTEITWIRVKILYKWIDGNGKLNSHREGK